MKIHDFIFSDKVPFRISRHVLFWSIRFLFLFLWFFSVYYVAPEAQAYNKIFLSIAPLVTYLAIDIAFCYSVIYWLLPRYLLKKKHLFFGFLLFVLTTIAILIKVQYTLAIHNQLGLPAEMRYIVIWMQVVYFINGGPPVICGLFVTIKMLKTWFVKEGEKVSIARANADAELQLLKAQIHPHFLFNTLNNIYSFNLSKRPVAGELVLKLIDTLKYMIKECEAPLVPLEKELKMLRDYTGLEKVRYGKRLSMEVEIIGNHENKLITPLLLIPFVENSFKHGSSKMLENPWIKMQINIFKNSLEFALSNSKPAHAENLNGKNGIGLTNVRKRLNLLYAGRYSLKINETANAYRVYLKLPLQEAEIPEPALNQKTDTPIPAI